MLKILNKLFNKSTFANAKQWTLHQNIDFLNLRTSTSETE